MKPYNHLKFILTPKAVKAGVEALAVKCIVDRSATTVSVGRENLGEFRMPQDETVAGLARILNQRLNRPQQADSPQVKAYLAIVDHVVREVFMMLMSHPGNFSIQTSDDSDNPLVFEDVKESILLAARPGALTIDDIRGKAITHLPRERDTNNLSDALIFTVANRVLKQLRDHTRSKIDRHIH